MRLASFEKQDRVRIGVVHGDRLVPLDDLGMDMLGLIAAGPRAVEDVRHHASANADPLALQDVRLLAPVPRPLKNIFAIGRNYAEHAQESAAVRGEKAGPPVFFTKAPTTVNAPFGDIIVDPAVSEQVDWEVELGVVISKAARKVPRENALEYVFGYTVLNDVSARDLQNRTSQFFIGKSLDGYCPMGPYIITADEIPDPQNLNLRCYVNGHIKQEGNTRSMLYDVATIIFELSRVLTLEPGDIIATGTPAGVGFARKPPEFLKPGDLLESEIVEIGKLRNRIVAP